MALNKEIPERWGIFDAHCHPTDTLSSLQQIPGMKANVLTVMATRAEDQKLVAEAADQYGLTLDEIKAAGFNWSEVHKIIPAFGWHPWFSHQLFEESAFDGACELSNEQKITHYQSVLTPESDDEGFLLSLPDPRPFGEFIAQTSEHLSRYPLALIGEVGLDKSFRIPEAWLPPQIEDRNHGLTPGGREGRQLSPYRVSMDHQRKILLAQLKLAGAEQRAVSVHGVAAHGVLYETLAETWKDHKRPIVSKRKLKKREAADQLQKASSEVEPGQAPADLVRPYPPRICLHSYSGPPETVKLYTAPAVPCEVFFSFSVTINTWSDDNDGKVEAAVRAVPDDRLLMESDLHTAGERMDTYLQEIVRKLCHIKGWELQDGMKRLRDNWMHFALDEQLS